MAHGIEAAINEANLPWSVVGLYAHTGYTFSPEPPRNGREARAADLPELRALMRVYMANRGVWEAGWWRGPAVSVAHTNEDVDLYVNVFREFLAEMA